jgi:hypothetical protein
MPVTFKIGKDDITRGNDTCPLPLELVKTDEVRKNSVNYRELSKIPVYYCELGKDKHARKKLINYRELGKGSVYYRELGRDKQM